MENTPDLENRIPDEFVSILRSAKRVAILTGAGISAESGIPTFRDAQSGLWAKYNPADLATVEAFQRNPRLVWEWYAWRRELVAQAQPNPAHLALAAMERHIPHFTLITQNVDSLHTRAGSANVIELHGNISRVKCFAENTVVESWPPTDEVPPRCPNCGALLRPDVVWFGELLPEGAFEAAVEAAAHSDVFFSIGTSGQVEPAASLTRVAYRMGAVVAIINPDLSGQGAEVHYSFQAAAGQILPLLVKKAWE